VIRLATRNVGHGRPAWTTGDSNDEKAAVPR
jgi:hypothetical protein